MMSKVTLILLFCLLLSSCSLIYRGVLGVDLSPQWMDDKDIVKKQNKLEIQSDFHLVLDTASYTNSIKEMMQMQMDSLPKDTSIMTKKLKYKVGSVANDDLQPTQVRLFTREGNEIFKLVNCYVDPPIPMDWNVDSCFNAFPPHLSGLVINTHNYDLDFLLRHTSDMKGNSVEISDLPEGDYYMVVMWNSFLIRPSKKLIGEVKDYIAANSERNIVLIYINNHNQQIWGQLDAETRKLVFEYEQELKEVEE